MATVLAPVMTEKVGIIGSGLIGRSWAMLFAAGGFQIAMYDSQENAVKDACQLILTQLKSLKQQGLLRGNLSVEEQFSLIHEAPTLTDCIAGASYIQESIPEQLPLKIELFRTIDELITKDDTVLASSSSTFPSSKFSEHLKHRSQVIIAHPVNPPYFLPLVELVPAPWTSPAITDKAYAIQTKIGQTPVILNKEILGFALNRIQFAILNESWRLVADGVLSVQDLDRVMKDGLGPRYAFMGPFETIHLNADGVRSYCQRLGPAIWGVSETFGPPPNLTTDEQVTAKIERQMEDIIPRAALEERRQWRDDRLAQLAKFKFGGKFSES